MRLYRVIPTADSKETRRLGMAPVEPTEDASWELGPRLYFWGERRSALEWARYKISRAELRDLPRPRLSVATVDIDDSMVTHEDAPTQVAGWFGEIYFTTETVPSSSIVKITEVR